MDFDLEEFKEELESHLSNSFHLEIQNDKDSEYNGKIFIFSSQRVDLTIWFDEDTFYIGNLEVYSSGEGIARKIVDFILEFCEACGFNKITATRIMKDGDTFWPHFNFYSDGEDYSYDL